jgi:hypothetical protein
MFMSFSICLIFSAFVSGYSFAIFTNEADSIEQEYNVEIQSIMQLIVIKKASFPRGGTLDDSLQAIEIRKEIQDLYIKNREAAVNAQIRRNDLRYNYAKQKNGIQRKWENEVGILKVYLKKFSTTNDAC